MPRADAIIVQTTERLLGEHCPPELVNAAEEGEFPASLWNLLEASALPQAWVAPELDGPGTTLTDGFAIARVAARFAAPVPLGETLLAGWLLSVAGIRAPAGPMTVLPVETGEGMTLDADGTISGRATRIPFGSGARHAGVIALRSGDPCIALIEMRPDMLAARRDRAVNAAGEPRESVVLGKCVPVAIGKTVQAGIGLQLRCMGAALRAQQMAGALERVLEQSLTYARDRHQFGRAIARFQAVQHNLAVLAGESAAAGAAADAAASAIERHGIADERTLFAVASAKIRAGEAAGAGAAIAHQVHGAMGFTREYSLHHATRRLWSWRDDFGAESVWAIRLGELVAGRGADALWPSITAL